MHIRNLKHLNCEIHLIKLIILVTAIKVENNFFPIQPFSWSLKLTPEKMVAQIELYHTLTLILNQPKEVVNKYF